MKLNPDQISYICFDFDGVILDTLQLKEDGFVFAYHDIATADADVIRSFQRANGGKPRHEKFRHFDHLFLKQEPDESRLATLSKRLSDHIMAGIENCPHIGGFSAFLSQLKDMNMPVAIASAMPEYELHEIIAIKKIAPAFRYALGAPRAKINQLKDIDTQFRDHPNAPQGLYFGDTMSDHEAAIGAGLNFMGVGHHAGFDDRDIPFIADFTAVTVTE